MFKFLLGALSGLGIAFLIVGYSFGWYFMIGMGVLWILEKFIWMEVA